MDLSLHQLQPVVLTLWCLGLPTSRNCRSSVVDVGAYWRLIFIFSFLLMWIITYATLLEMLAMFIISCACILFTRKPTYPTDWVARFTFMVENMSWLERNQFFIPSPNLAHSNYAPINTFWSDFEYSTIFPFRCWSGCDALVFPKIRKTNWCVIRARF